MAARRQSSLVRPDAAAAAGGPPGDLRLPRLGARHPRDAGAGSPPHRYNGRLCAGPCRAAGRREREGGPGDPGTPVVALEAEAVRIHQEDIAACRRIGANGEALLPAGVSLLTHCNTGSLATGGHATPPG